MKRFLVLVTFMLMSASSFAQLNIYSAAIEANTLTQGGSGVCVAGQVWLFTSVDDEVDFTDRFVFAGKFGSQVSIPSRPTYYSLGLLYEVTKPQFTLTQTDVFVGLKYHDVMGEGAPSIPNWAIDVHVCAPINVHFGNSALKVNLGADIIPKHIEQTNVFIGLVLQNSHY